MKLFVIASLCYLVTLLWTPVQAQSSTTQAVSKGVNTSKAEQEILQTQKKRFALTVDGDLQALSQVLADDLRYTHSNGKMDNKEEYLKTMSSGKTNYNLIEPEDVKVQVYDNTGVVTGRAHVMVYSEGKDLDLQLRFTEVYVKKKGKWQLAAWQSTRIL